MPNIREYNAPELGLRPNNTGMDSVVAAGRRTAAAYRDAGDTVTELGNRVASTVRTVGDVAVKFAEHEEVSKGAAAFSAMQADLTKKWNDTAKNADPNDPAVAQKFREEVVEPRLQKFQDSFLTSGGQKFADSHTAKLRDEMFTKTAADMSTLAGIAVRNNYTTTVNSLSNMVRTDPSSLNTALSTVDSSVGALADSNPNMDAATAARIKSELTLSAKSEIVKSAAIGAISINPEAGLKKFSGSEYAKYISGSELQQLTQQAKAVQRAERVDQSYQRTLAEQQRKDASDQREGELLEKLHSGDPSVAGTVSAKAIASDWTLTREARERMINIVNRETKPETAAAVSNGTASDLIRRIRLPIGDPNRVNDLNPVYEALENGKLNKSDLKFVREEFANMRTPEGEQLSSRQADFIKGVKPLIDSSNPLLSKLDPSGSHQLYRFTIDLQRKVSEYRNAGRDPYSLMTPGSPDYMGWPAALAPYQKPIQDSLRDIAAALRPSGNLTAPGTTITGISVQDLPPVKPRQPNETPEQYLKRLGIK
ncbi:hypothetical protein CSIRO_2780 [Bradyrhizobiaceae bacterium SG-6C]|nr:hypothetical protein CSIRO_2780 [Bradyrhizobiaceae bacterium SG-6C]